MMKRVQYYKILFILVLSGMAIIAKPQQSRVDSVINLLQKSKTKKGIDTAQFITATKLLGKTSITEIGRASCRERV